MSTPSPEPIKLVSNQPAPRSDIVPGKIHCAKCGFTLQRVSLYVLSGTVGAGGNETEACPNDGNPMLPITWEQEAREAWKRCEEMFERAVLAEGLLAAAGTPVYLVATGQAYGARETYTRHEVRPPLCDAEALYTHPPAALTQRALAIADAQMFVALESYGIARGARPCVIFDLADDEECEVRTVAEAREELREAVEWLRERDYVEIGSDAKGEFVIVLRRVGDA